VTHPEGIKIVIRLQRRRDGGLRAWSDDVPGLVLSHRDADRVLADIIPAVETIMAEMLGVAVQASPLRSARDVVPAPHRAPTMMDHVRSILARLSRADETREYAALPQQSYAEPCAA
jgi:hypothetical protein